MYALLPLSRYRSVLPAKDGAFYPSKLTLVHGV